MSSNIYYRQPVRPRDAGYTDLHDLHTKDTTLVQNKAHTELPAGIISISPCWSHHVLNMMAREAAESCSCHYIHSIYMTI